MSGPVNGTWVNQFLASYAAGVLLGVVSPPRYMSLYKNAVTIDPTLTFASLNVDTTIAVDVLSSWTFTVQPGNYIEADATVNISMDDSYSGSIYYGVCLYTAADLLAWYSPFSSLFVVTNGGTILQILPQLRFGDCSQTP